MQPVDRDNLMTPSLSRSYPGEGFFHVLLACAMALCLFAGACKNANSHTSDPQLKGIDALLAAQLPPGTTSARVVNFVHTRGYEQRTSVQPHTLVVIVNHINPETVQPEAARVTFRLDADDKLVGYDLEPAPTLPIR
jgi:hypothetical protein